MSVGSPHIHDECEPLMGCGFLFEPSGVFLEINEIFEIFGFRRLTLRVTGKDVFPAWFAVFLQGWKHSSKACV